MSSPSSPVSNSSTQVGPDEPLGEPLPKASGSAAGNPAQSLSNTSNPQVNIATPHSSAAPPGKPVVIGVYGVSGSGKSFLLKKLEAELNPEHFITYEGGARVNSYLDSGVYAAKSAEVAASARQSAIVSIGSECAASGKAGIVAGHAILFSEETGETRPVHTKYDHETYTHIIYLDVDPALIADRRENDKSRIRPYVSELALGTWKEEEQSQVQSACLGHGILFTRLKTKSLLQRVKALVQDFRLHTPQLNMTRALQQLDQFWQPTKSYVDTFLVIDGDKTLTAQDTGESFWIEAAHSGDDHTASGYTFQDLQRIFNSGLGYSHQAFRQAMLMYEEAADDDAYDTVCDAVASRVEVYPEFMSLLAELTEKSHIGIVVVTCGVGLIWQKIIQRIGLSETVKVIGGGRLSDGYVVTPEVKRSVVKHLQQAPRAKVWAFGDSPLDLDMLKQADRAVVVVGEADTRSRSMEHELKTAIDNDGLQAHQVLLPGEVLPRLDTSTLPKLKLDDQAVRDEILARAPHRDGLHVVHATKKPAAKILMTPTRDARCSGPSLRHAHGMIGFYLAIEYLSDLVGLEDYPMKHVLGYDISGQCLIHERQTLIVALMRGGEPLALGVSKAIPKAMLLHAKSATEITAEKIKGVATIVLVDSVINTGKSIIEFVQHIRTLHTKVRIVIIASVVQDQCVQDDGPLPKLAERDSLTLIALRLSETKYTGKGTTDTGNRLFNTTHLD